MPTPATLHEAMTARVARGEFPGLVTLVARGEDVRVDAIGVTHDGGDVPMRRDTPFRITSMTKPIVAAATMMLAEDDLLDLEEPVQRLLPELAERRVLRAYDAELGDTVPAHRPITVDDLLTFRLGWGYIAVPEMMPSVPVTRRADELGLGIGPPDPRTPHDPDEWIRHFGTLPLIYQPGESWAYNTGSDILGVLLARAAGQPLGDLLRERVFTPLGMTHTGFHVPASLAERLPGQYSADPSTGKLVPNEHTGPSVWSTPPSFPSGAGGLVSTVDDYLAFARMLLNRGVHGGTRLLAEKSVERMTTNHLTPEQIRGGGLFLNGSGWGLGMAVTVEPGDSGVGTYGWSGGYGTDWFTDPRAGVIGIAMTQVSDFLWNGALPEFVRLAHE